MELQIQFWDPKTMPNDATILIVGARHTGKSILTRDIMWHKRSSLDLVIGMNPTEMGSKTLSYFTPPALQFHKFDDAKLTHLLEWQRRCVANKKAMKIGFVMDDCMAETNQKTGGKRKVMGSGDIVKVFKLGRWLNLFYLNCMQFIKDAPPEIRGNVDLLFVFNTSSGAEREKLWKEYFAMIGNFKDFTRIFESCAKGYDCIVLDRRRALTHPTECIYYYKATVREPFHTGREIFWKLSEKFYVDRADYSMDPSRVLGSSLGSAIAPSPALFIKKERSDELEDLLASMENPLDV